ncbi:MAG: hypothetical protein SFW66_03765 [Gammaproteobacteria bacterium]|nr:hypothetical protein [Gammaproteobacteria bacterium]
MEGRSQTDIIKSLFALQHGFTPQDLKTPVAIKAIITYMLLSQTRATSMGIEPLNAFTNVINIICTKLQSSTRPVDKQNYEHYDNLTTPKLKEVTHWEEKCANFWQRLEDTISNFHAFCQKLASTMHEPGSQQPLTVPIEITKALNKSTYEIAELIRERSKHETSLSTDIRAGESLVPEQLRGEVVRARKNMHNESQRMG